VTEERRDVQPETLDALFELLRGSPRAQQVVQESLDEKAVRGLTFGAVVLGFSAIGTTGDAGGATLALTLAALAAFVVLAGLAIWQLWPADYMVIDDADKVWQKHWHLDGHDFKHATVERAAEAYAGNRKANKEKARKLVAILTALAVEAALVAGAVVSAMV
jgi:hypothetical protein